MRLPGYSVTLFEGKQDASWAFGYHMNFAPTPSNVSAPHPLRIECPPTPSELSAPRTLKCEWPPPPQM